LAQTARRIRKMANGRIPMIVTAPNGTDLRREPHTGSKTEDGGDNVILFLPKGSYLRLEDEDIYATDKYRWARLSLKVRSKTITGWVIADDLGPPVEEKRRKTHTFSFGEKSYKIFRDKLDAAIGQYIFEERKPNTKRVNINNTWYFTNQGHIDAMKHPRIGWVKEVSEH
jgi:hypothetical protein